MAQSAPSGTNTFIPAMVQDNLIVGYARNPDKFALNRYIQIVPTPKNQAYYLYIDGAAAVRLTNTDHKGIIWPDGSKRPTSDNNLADFEFKPIATRRRSFEFTVGNMAVEQAVWPIVDVNAGFQATRAMTERTASVWAALAAASWGSNTGTATALGGGFVGTGTADGSGNGYVFKKIVHKAKQQIRKATFGAVLNEEMVCIMSPLVAETIAESKEIHAYLKESPFALAQIRGDAPNQNMNYGLPEVIYKTRIIVEDSYKVTSKKNSAGTSTQAAVADENSLYFLSRPGTLEFPYGGMSFSTVQLFEREAMAVEVHADPKNRLTQGFVTDDYDPYAVAVASGFQVTAALS